MIAYLNGAFVPQGDAKVPVTDRSFLYGDGLFETLRVVTTRPFRWEDHWRRLADGADRLGLRLPAASAEMASSVAELVRRNGLSEAVVRLTVSRGVGGPGYAARGADSPTVAMTVRAAPTVDPNQPGRWRLRTASLRLAASDPLARFKTCNRLIHVLARTEAEAAGADEALLLNTEGHVAEASSANVFWIENERVFTPPLADGGLAGVTRSVVLDLCRRSGIATREQSAALPALDQADGVFLTLSTLGIVEVASLDDRALGRARVTTRLHQAYQQCAAEESRAHPRIAS